jgi:plastocyanin
MMVQHPVSRAAWTGAALLLLAAASVAPRLASSTSEPVRDIHLVARDMTYYLDGVGEPNPTLRLSRGERVRIHLVNRDPGMMHDFTVGAWAIETRPIGTGEATIELTAPVEPGETPYACTPHGEMMRGTIRVE